MGARRVTDHALHQLREKLKGHSLEREKSGRLADMVLQSVEKNWHLKLDVNHKGKRCHIVPLGDWFPVPLYAAVVGDVTTILDASHVEQNKRTGRWDGWYMPEGPLTVPLWQMARRK